jgi:uncharacterized protein (DUF1501 family)
MAEAGVRFIEISTQGWDHHNGLADSHTRNLQVLDTALGEFYMQLRAQNDDSDLPPGTLQDVTAFTASDFGRALHRFRCARYRSNELD